MGFVDFVRFAEFVGFAGVKMRVVMTPLILDADGFGNDWCWDSDSDSDSGTFGTDSDLGAFGFVGMNGTVIETVALLVAALEAMATCGVPAGGRVAFVAFVASFADLGVEFDFGLSFVASVAVGETVCAQAWRVCS